MPISCKCTLDHLKYKGTITEKEYDKLLRNLKGTDSIVVQIDCLMPIENVMAFRKDLLYQMKDGIIVIPPWAHVSHVGDECDVEIKRMDDDELPFKKNREAEIKEVLQTLEKLYNDFTMRPDECKALDFAINFIKEKSE
jgi:hypothetical protein